MEVSTNYQSVFAGKLMNQNTNEIIALLITQVSEAGNSYRREKLGLTKALTYLSQNTAVEQITTDRHKQI